VWGLKPQLYSGLLGDDLLRTRLRGVVHGGARMLEAFGRVLGGTTGGSGSESRWVGKVKRLMGVLGVLYAIAWILVRWHRFFVDG